MCCNLRSFIRDGFCETKLLNPSWWFSWVDDGMRYFSTIHRKSLTLYRIYFKEQYWAQVYILTVINLWSYVVYRLVSNFTSCSKFYTRLLQVWYKVPYGRVMFFVCILYGYKYHIYIFLPDGWMDFALKTQVSLGVWKMETKCLIFGVKC